MKIAMLLFVLFPLPALARYSGDSDGGLGIILLLAITLTLGTLHSKLKRFLKNPTDVEKEYVHYAGNLPYDDVNPVDFFGHYFLDSPLVEYLVNRNIGNKKFCLERLSNCFDHYVQRGKIDSDYIPLVSNEIRNNVAEILYDYFTVEQILTLVKEPNLRAYLKSSVSNLGSY